MSGAGGLQELHAADLELIGEGGNSRVYRLEGNRVVKVLAVRSAALMKKPS